MPPTQNGFDQATRERLVKLCGLLKSPFDGERSAAALKACELLHRRGLAWEDAIRAAALPDARAKRTSHSELDWRNAVAECLSRPDLLSPRELNFLSSAQSFPRLSPKQQAWLDAIVAKVRGA